MRSTDMLPGGVKKCPSAYPNKDLERTEVGRLIVDLTVLVILSGGVLSALFCGVARLLHLMVGFAGMLPLGAQFGAS